MAVRTPPAGGREDPEPPRQLPDTTDWTTELPSELDPDYCDIESVCLDGVVMELPEITTLGLRRVRMRGGSIRVGADARVSIVDCELHDVDLQGLEVEELVRVQLLRCRLTGADLGRARVSHTRMEDCALDLASMRASEIKDTVVRGGRWDELDLTAAKLERVRFEDGTLDGTLLDGMRAKRVDLRRAELGASVDPTSLRGCQITLSQALAIAPRLAAAAGITVSPHDSDDDVHGS